MKILLVDDTVMILDHIGEMLEGEGHEVITESNPRLAAKNYGDDQSFDAIITDWQMPGMNGIELAALFKELNSDIPIVIYTSAPDEAERLKTDDIDEIICKTGTDELIEWLESVNPDADSLVAEPGTICRHCGTSGDGAVCESCFEGGRGQGFH